MGKMLDCLRKAIAKSYIPENQKLMQERIVVEKKPKEMSCKIFPYRGIDYLLCQFDKQDFNNLNFPYFNASVDGLVCMCDYILFVEEDDRLLVLLIELKHKNDSPRKQLTINQSFAQFICDRLTTVFEGFNKPFFFRKIGIKERYRPKEKTLGHVFSFDENGYALLPKPSEMVLKTISQAIA